jgi:hypothetical protein
MHITDWKSTAWLRALGQKSSSIVDDVEFRPGKVISKNLIGHFDPNNSDSYDDSNGGDTYENLAVGGEDLCLHSMDTVPAGESGAPDFEGPTITTPGYFMGDGDNWMGQCGGGYSSDFELQADNDFTLNVWVQVDTAALGKSGPCPNLEGYIGVGPMNQYENGGCCVGVIGDYAALPGGQPAPGAAVGRIALFVGDPTQSEMPMFSDRRSIGSYVRHGEWHMFSLVKETGVPIFGGGTYFDRVTVYLDGIYQRLISGDNCSAATPHLGERIPSGVIGGLQLINVMALLQSYSGMEQPSPASRGNFGHILVYNRALKHSELRQNYLALNHIYYPWRQGGAIGPNHPNH